MNRGYIKFWRKAQDSSSWNRGLMYQGLIINLLSRAAWKKGSYQGRDILPGQFGVILNRLAESLDVPRSTLQRMVAHLEADGFLSVENVGNRFSIVTIVNWHIYQMSEDDVWAAGGPPVVDQRAADGPPLKEEELKNKKEEGCEFNAGACVATVVPEIPFEPGSEPENFLQPQSPKKTDSPSKGTPEWWAFLACWDVYPVKQGQEDAWREWMRLKVNGTLAESFVIRDAILLMVGEDSRWARGFIPKMTKWLNGKGWDDQPYIEPTTLPVVSPALGGVARDGPPRATTQFQKGKQDLEGIAAFVMAADKEFQHGFDPENFDGAWAHGNALPAPAGLERRTPSHGPGLDGVVPRPHG